MTPTLLEVYRQLLSTADLTVTADHMVSGKLVDELAPILVDGKRLVLPTPAYQAADKSEIVLFHPLYETINRGRSHVLEKYRSLLVHRFNKVTSFLMLELLRIAVTEARHKDLTPDQSEFLSLVKDADRKTEALLDKIIDTMVVEQTARQHIAIFLKKTGLIADRSYKRVGVVSFPLYEELRKPEHDVWGIKCSAKDKRTLAALLEYIFPQIGEAQAYDRGSHSDIAPNLHALMQASLAIIQALNDITETFESQLDKPGSPVSEWLIDADWQETFMNLGVMQTEIWRTPAQAGNEGVPWEELEAPQATPAAQPARPAPLPEAAPRVAVPPQRVSLDDAMARPPAMALRQSQPMSQPAQPDLTYTERGLDFGSVMRANPALAGPGFGQVPPAPSPQTSQWAQRAEFELSQQSMYPRNWPGPTAGSASGNWGMPGPTGPIVSGPGTRRGLI